MKTKQNIRRLEKAIDELIKVQDSGKGTAAIQRILDALNDAIYAMENKE